MTEQTPAQEQAAFLVALAEHLQAHPHLNQAQLHGRAGHRTLRLLPSLDHDDDDNDPAGLAAWARSLGVDRLSVMAITDQEWSPLAVRVGLTKAVDAGLAEWRSAGDSGHHIAALTVAGIAALGEWDRAHPARPSSNPGGDAA